MTYSTPRDEHETKTRVMLDQYFKCEENDTILARAIAQVILAKFNLALPIHKFFVVAEAFVKMDFNHTSVTPSEVQKILTRMTRAKIMRSRMNSGTRLYEVNY